MKSKLVPALSGLVLLVIALVLFLLVHGGTANSVTGQNGEVLTVSKTTQVSAGEAISVSGKGFDKTVGIYVEMCQIVPAGTLPSVCGGGQNMTGAGSWGRIVTTKARRHEETRRSHSEDRGVK